MDTTVVVPPACYGRPELPRDHPINVAARAARKEHFEELMRAKKAKDLADATMQAKVDANVTESHSAAQQAPEPATLQQEPQPATLQQEPQPATLQHEPQPATLQQEPQPATLQQEPQPATLQQEPQPPTLQQEPLPPTLQQEPQHTSDVYVVAMESTPKPSTQPDDLPNDTPIDLPTASGDNGDVVVLTTNEDEQHAFLNGPTRASSRASNCETLK
jgi:hypothetical protein